MKASISVVIPTHNRVGPLERALNSVLQQSYAAREVLIVDDGSEDGTSEMVAERFPGFTVLSQPNRGVSAARNRGVRAAGHEWIALLDSDDEWLPGKLEAQIAALEADPAQRLCHCDEIWMRNGIRVNPRLRHRKAGGWIFRQCLPLCAISPSATLLHRSVFDECGFFDESLPACEDYEFWLRYTARNPVLFVDRPLMIKHGGHADQLSRRVEALDRYRIRALAKLLDGSPLTAPDRAAAVATLLEKISIYKSGVVKRGRSEEVARLERLAARFQAA
ncbi:MAG: glycosyltransferase [bacterium]|nr:glycosyltransferase [bacterium]